MCADQCLFKQHMPRPGLHLATVPDGVGHFARPCSHWHCLKCSGGGPFRIDLPCLEMRAGLKYEPETPLQRPPMAGSTHPYAQLTGHPIFSDPNSRKMSLRSAGFVGVRDVVVVLHWGPTIRMANKPKQQTHNFSFSELVALPPCSRDARDMSSSSPHRLCMVLFCVESVP